MKRGKTPKLLEGSLKMVAMNQRKDFSDTTVRDGLKSNSVFCHSEVRIFLFGIDNE